MKWTEENCIDQNKANLPEAIAIALDLERAAATTAP